VTPGGIRMPDGRIVPGWLIDDDTFIDLTERIWKLAPDGLWTPPPEHLDEQFG
jgi:hypothetical protein